MKFSDSSAACHWAANTITGDDTAGRKYSDNTYAVSCAAYKNGGGYQGATGDGIYWIDTDGFGGGAEFKVYCDMTTGDGAWTIHFTDTWTNFIARNPTVPLCKSYVLEKNCYSNNFNSQNIWKMSNAQALTRYTGNGSWANHSWYINTGNSTHVLYCSGSNTACVFGIGGPGNCSSTSMRSFCY